MKTLKQVCLCAVFLLIGGWSVYGLIELVQREKTKDVVRQFGVALDQAEKVPPGLARGETLLRGLRAIDRGFAPADVKQALAGYTAALQGALDAMKAGRETSAFDEELATQKLQFADAIERHK